MLGLDNLTSHACLLEVITVGSEEGIVSKDSAVTGKMYFENTSGFRRTRQIARVNIQLTLHQLAPTSILLEIQSA